MPVFHGHLNTIPDASGPDLGSALTGSGVSSTGNAVPQDRITDGIQPIAQICVPNLTGGVLVETRGGALQPTACTTLQMGE